MMNILTLIGVGIGFLLANAAEFVYRQLKRVEPGLLASFQAIWPQFNIVKVSVVPRINNQDAREAIKVGK
jgi:hypothetical protein